MILANEAVAALLAGRRREALYRVHERPDPQSVALLLAKLADLDVPTPPAPERLTPQAAAELAGAASRARRRATSTQSGRGREAFPSLVLRALKQARYDPREPRPLGAREPRVLPLHVADPPLPGPRRPPRAAARARRSATTRRAEDLAELAEHASAREREAAQLEYLADEICLAWLLESRALRARLGGAVRGRDHRR